MPFNPVSTYRIQFSGKFTFKDFSKIIPYLHTLGVKTIYASPLFSAVPGSEHCYDVVNPLMINPEIGTIEEFREIHNRLKSLGMVWIQDIVPNHMAFSIHNPWIGDILEKGRGSAYSTYFDIDWDHPDERLQGKFMLPFLDKHPEELIDAGEILISFNNKQFVLKHFDNEYPLNFESCQLILESGNKGVLPDEMKELSGIFNKAISSKNLRNRINKSLSNINNSPDDLKSLITLQHYVPVYWKESEKLLNYRRFFTINGMICLRAENKDVFDTYHSFLADLCSENLLQGLRVDHIDGLYDPAEYLDRLRDLAGSDKYIIVEKILEKGESLEKSWPVQGETGYHFMALANNILTCKENLDLIDKSYKYWKRDHEGSFDDILYSRKRLILHNSMAGDLDNLWMYFINLFPEVAGYFDQGKLKSALGEILVCCPVYKIYNSPGNFTKGQSALLKVTFNKAIERSPGLVKELHFLKEIFLVLKRQGAKNTGKAEALFRRLMQFTGALMAKGGEDTAYYTYNRFIAHNEVGDSPVYFGISADDFHEEMKRRLRNFPLSLNASSTHDTKRGEDARARLIVLGDIPELWDKQSRRWRSMNRKFKQIKDNKEIPCLNDEYFIYQTLVGFMPTDMAEADADFIRRLEGYIIKALREGKEQSGWSEPDLVYEGITVNFIKSILTGDTEFTASLRNFLGIVAFPGIINSLSQLIIKFTAPGIPDIYQGSEDWNFSFVDPDNRRAVDFSKLQERLGKLKQERKGISDLFAFPADPDIKIAMTHLLLGMRSDYPGLFEHGEYIPLKTKGRLKGMVLAYARRYSGRVIIAVVPLHPGSNYLKRKNNEISAVEWEDTAVKLPDFFPDEYEDLLTGRSVNPGDCLLLSELFTQIPFSVLIGQKRSSGRKAGILMHISSLPGKYPAGDFGEEAYRFADFLKRNGVSCWQILPLNQVYEGGGYSPYSPLSAFAGNVSFINPDLLADQGLISRLPEIDVVSPSCQADYKRAEKLKNEIIDAAFRIFKKGSFPALRKEFESFREKEKYWLGDYSLFIALKKKFSFSGWNEWPKPLRDRDPSALRQFMSGNHDLIEREEFAQFLFMKQWEMLKSYCNRIDIEIFGDVPIYVNYDSADVWSHPELFKLKGNRDMKYVAGVPPDYFSDTGQLWNMPVFRWDIMKKDGFAWWKNRIRKNLEMFDLLRLDHFRGFSACWEVPEGKTTAIEGKWIRVPGNIFFDELMKEFPDMPFVAEDLGLIDPEVERLRDKYNLPGMKVLQFAFGEDFPSSVHVPHNHTCNSVVYTGTHDNNTIKGWYKHETEPVHRKNLRRYLGKKIDFSNCHTEMIRLAFSSVAKLAIIPFQDILGLDEETRMNRPATEEGNWIWRLRAEELNHSLERKLRTYIKIYGRV